MNYDKIYNGKCFDLPMNLLFLHKKAFETRRNLEQRKIPVRLLTNLYKKYNPIKNISKFIEDSKEFFPELNCGIASVYLRHVLQQGEIVIGSYGKEPHTFLLINSETIVDITSDQYGGPKVYIGPIDYPWSL